MNPLVRNVLAAAALVAAGGCTGGGPDRDDDLTSALEAIPGLTVSEQPTALEGYRFFQLTFEQPADHAVPGGNSFAQRVTLLHRDADAPMILATAGYGISFEDRRAEPTVLLGANQLSVEHRFFPPSRPEPADWSLLTIEQAAADHHRIAEAFAPLYSGAWINTGASKGGMTAIFHRRFHPADVDATIAYVAPLSLAAGDTRYVTFLEQVGDAACRQALIDFQRDALGRRAAMLSRLGALAAERGIAFDLLGSEVAFEHAVLELPFAFWQYGSASQCASIPAGAATDDEVFAFIDAVSFFELFSDDLVLYFEPYYYQAATQLGYPAISETAVADLLQHPGTDHPRTYVVTPVAVPAFDPAPMQDIAGWVASDASALMFVYGADDPWTAGAFAVGAATDAHLFTVPGGNHGASILDLQGADRAAALAVLESWTGVTPQAPAGAASVPRAIERTPL